MSGAGAIQTRPERGKSASASPRLPCPGPAPGLPARRCRMCFQPRLRLQPHPDEFLAVALEGAAVAAAEEAGEGGNGSGSGSRSQASQQLCIECVERWRQAWPLEADLYASSSAAAAAGLVAPAASACRWCGPGDELRFAFRCGVQACPYAICTTCLAANFGGAAVEQARARFTNAQAAAGDPEGWKCPLCGPAGPRLRAHPALADALAVGAPHPYQRLNPFELAEGVKGMTYLTRCHPLAASAREEQEGERASFQCRQWQDAALASQPPVSVRFTSEAVSMLLAQFAQETEKNNEQYAHVPPPWPSIEWPPAAAASQVEAASSSSAAAATPSSPPSPPSRPPLLRIVSTSFYRHSHFMGHHMGRKWGVTVATHPHLMYLWGLLSQVDRFRTIFPEAERWVLRIYWDDSLTKPCGCVECVSYEAEARRQGQGAPPPAYALPEVWALLHAHLKTLPFVQLRYFNWPHLQGYDPRFHRGVARTNLQGHNDAGWHLGHAGMLARFLALEELGQTAELVLLSDLDGCWTPKFKAKLDEMMAERCICMRARDEDYKVELWGGASAFAWYPPPPPATAASSSAAAAAVAAASSQPPVPPSLTFRALEFALHEFMTWHLRHPEHIRHFSEYDQHFAQVSEAARKKDTMDMLRKEKPGWTDQQLTQHQRELEEQATVAEGAAIKATEEASSSRSKGEKGNRPSQRNVNRKRRSAPAGASAAAAGSPSPSHSPSPIPSSDGALAVDDSMADESDDDAAAAAAAAEAAEADAHAQYTGLFPYSADQLFLTHFVWPVVQETARELEAFALGRGGSATSGAKGRSVNRPPAAIKTLNVNLPASNKVDLPWAKVRTPASSAAAAGPRYQFKHFLAEVPAFPRGRPKGCSKVEPEQCFSEGTVLPFVHRWIAQHPSSGWKWKEARASPSPSAAAAAAVAAMRKQEGTPPKKNAAVASNSALQLDPNRRCSLRAREKAAAAAAAEEAAAAAVASNPDDDGEEKEEEEDEVGAEEEVQQDDEVDEDECDEEGFQLWPEAWQRDTIAHSAASSSNAAEEEGDTQMRSRNCTETNKRARHRSDSPVIVDAYDNPAPASLDAAAVRVKRPRPYPAPVASSPSVVMSVPPWQRMPSTPEHKARYNPNPAPLSDDDEEEEETEKAGETGADDVTNDAPATHATLGQAAHARKPQEVVNKQVHKEVLEASPRSFEEGLRRDAPEERGADPCEDEGYDHEMGDASMEAEVQPPAPSTPPSPPASPRAPSGGGSVTSAASDAAPPTPRPAPSSPPPLDAATSSSCDIPILPLLTQVALMEAVEQAAQLAHSQQGEHDADAAELSAPSLERESSVQPAYRAEHGPAAAVADASFANAGMPSPMEIDGAEPADGAHPSSSAAAAAATAIAAANDGAPVAPVTIASSAASAAAANPPPAATAAIIAVDFPSPVSSCPPPLSAASSSAASSPVLSLASEVPFASCAIASVSMGEIAPHAHAFASAEADAEAEAEMADLDAAAAVASDARTPQKRVADGCFAPHGDDDIVVADNSSNDSSVAPASVGDASGRGASAVMFPKLEPASDAASRAAKSCGGGAAAAAAAVASSRRCISLLDDSDEEDDRAGAPAGRAPVPFDPAGHDAGRAPVPFDPAGHDADGTATVAHAKKLLSAFNWAHPPELSLVLDYLVDDEVEGDGAERRKKWLRRAALSVAEGDPDPGLQAYKLWQADHVHLRNILRQIGRIQTVALWKVPPQLHAAAKQLHAILHPY